jgi:glycosyltransferase involved in cell wall biosynthesis
MFMFSPYYRGLPEHGGHDRSEAGVDLDVHQERNLPRLNIALVHWAFPPTVGGVESHLWSYSRLLAREGHQVTIFTGTPGAKPPSQSNIEVLHHDGLDLAKDPGAFRTQGDLRSWFGDELGNRGIRLVHGHNLHHFSAAPAEALLELREVMGLVLMHTYHSLWREQESLEVAKSCARWDAHFAVSDFLSDACASVLGIDDVQRTYLGIDTEPYLRVPELEIFGRNRSGVVLLPARLIPDKGAATAIDAFRSVLADDTGVRPHLILLDPPDSVDFHGEKTGFRDLLTRKIKEFNISDHVEFKRAGLERMPDLYSKAGVVINPSKYEEPMGLAPLEAMCAARPVIATRKGGLSEGIGEDGMFGYLVPDQGGADELALRITELLRNPEKARSMGSQGRKRVQAEFDLADCYLPPMIRQYRQMLQTTPAPEPSEQGIEHASGRHPANRTGLGVGTPGNHR